MSSIGSSSQKVYFSLVLKTSSLRNWLFPRGETAETAMRSVRPGLKKTKPIAFIFYTSHTLYFFIARPQPVEISHDSVVNILKGNTNINPASFRLPPINIYHYCSIFKRCIQHSELDYYFDHT